MKYWGDTMKVPDEAWPILEILFQGVTDRRELVHLWVVGCIQLGVDPQERLDACSSALDDVDKEPAVFRPDLVHGSSATRADDVAGTVCRFDEVEDEYVEDVLAVMCDPDFNAAVSRLKGTDGIMIMYDDGEMVILERMSPSEVRYNRSYWDEVAE